jgi:hypothetical protein
MQTGEFSECDAPDREVRCHRPEVCAPPEKAKSSLFLKGGARASGLPFLTSR